MISYPVAVRIKFTKMIPAEVSNVLIQEATEKTDEMYFLNKMDLYINFIDEYTTHRYFVDNAAADEWVEFIQDATSRNNLGIDKIEIINV